MRTEHYVYFQSSAGMDQLSTESVDLIVTSPPYPMIEMWDATFGDSSSSIVSMLDAGDGPGAYELMHQELDRVWEECARVLRPGGFLTINVGDATRSLDGRFRLYSNHARIISHCERLGLQSLPLVLWRKQTNAPNKFMGSGMLPSGAYVTLEHEYVLVFRKGGKREFTPGERPRRRRSALFWEERNTWFSDLWDFKGTRQELGGGDVRARSGAFPLEPAHRLICMYSMQGDLVLDPFVGTGTTLAAGLINGRNTVGYEIAEGLAPTIDRTMSVAASAANGRVVDRLLTHQRFVEERNGAGKPVKHTSDPYGFPVMTSQETGLHLPTIQRIEGSGPGRWAAEHEFPGLEILARPSSAVTDAEHGSQQQSLF